MRQLDRLNYPHRIVIKRANQVVKTREFQTYNEAQAWARDVPPDEGKAQAWRFTETTVELDGEPIPPAPEPTPAQKAFKAWVAEEVWARPVPDIEAAISDEEYFARWEKHARQLADVLVSIKPLLRYARKNLDVPLPVDAIRVFKAILGDNIP